MDELADRPFGFTAKDAIRYRHLLPLSEIVEVVIGEENPASSKVWGIYTVTEKFGSEYAVMLDVLEDQLVEAAGVGLARAILRVRNEEV